MSMERLWREIVCAVDRNPGLPFAVAIIVILVAWLALR